MSRYIDKALALRASEDRHYNCAQSVLIPFAHEAGLDQETAARLTTHFGSGMRRGSVCGAIAGGLMVLGLTGADDPAVVGEYYRQLREAHNGMFDCADLLAENRRRGGDRASHCTALVCECIALAEELARREGKISGE